MGLSVKRLSTHIGAEVSGIDLGTPLDRANLTFRWARLFYDGLLAEQAHPRGSRLLQHVPARPTG